MWLLGGHAWLWGGCIGYDEIWSMSGWYTSYWNAFLYTKASDFAQFSITHILSVMEIITGVVVEIITGVNNNTVMSPMTKTMIVVTYSL